MCRCCNADLDNALRLLCTGHLGSAGSHRRTHFFLSCTVFDDGEWSTRCARRIAFFFATKAQGGVSAGALITQPHGITGPQPADSHAPAPATQQHQNIAAATHCTPRLTAQSMWTLSMPRFPGNGTVPTTRAADTGAFLRREWHGTHNPCCRRWGV